MGLEGKKDCLISGRVKGMKSSSPETGRMHLTFIELDVLCNIAIL